MIGFVALGIVMLLWVLTWERLDETDRGPAGSAGASPDLPDTRVNRTVSSTRPRDNAQGFEDLG